ncbi:MAG: hypothetical protein K6C40_05295 [Thermoguttaceae bacterium]|nr:hypothetical protein [Thermoguttaceae bacterium]
MGSAANFNSVLETLHRMHKQFAELMEQVNGGLRKIHGTELRIAEMQALQDEAVKAALNQRILTDSKQAMLEENEKGIVRKKKLQDEAKNEKEFNNFRDQIAAAEAANAVLSDEILEGLEYLDELNTKAEEARKNLQAAKDRLADMKSKTQEVRERAEEEIRRLKVDFRKVEEQLNGEHQMLYQRLFKVKKFDSLAPVDHQSCAVCHTTIPVDQIAKIVSGAAAIACPQCGRMLYIPTDHHI